MLSTSRTWGDAQREAYLVEELMGFRFRQSLRLAKGIRLNFSKSGVSLSLGGRGATANVSKHGIRTTMSMPGTGISHTSYAPFKDEQDTTVRNGTPADQTAGCFLLLAVAIIAAALAMLPPAVRWWWFYAVPIAFGLALVIREEWILRKETFEYPESGVDRNKAARLVPKRYALTVDLLADRDRLTNEPATRRRVARVHEIDLAVAAEIPASCFKPRLYQAHDERPSNTPLVPQAWGITLAVIGSACILAGFGRCTGALLKSGHDGLVADEQDRCEALHRTAAIGEVEYQECIDAVERFRKQ